MGIEDWRPRRRVCRPWAGQDRFRMTSMPRGRDSLCLMRCASPCLGFGDVVGLGIVPIGRRCADRSICRNSVDTGILELSDRGFAIEQKDLRALISADSSCFHVQGEGLMADRAGELVSVHGYVSAFQDDAFGSHFASVHDFMPVACFKFQGLRHCYLPSERLGAEPGPSEAPREQAICLAEGIASSESRPCRSRNRLRLHGPFSGSWGSFSFSLSTICRNHMS